MFDQSFSAHNFRKILDIENRKGRYLEAEFFPNIERQSRKIKQRQQYIRMIQEWEKDKSNSNYTPERLKETEKKLLESLNCLKESRDEMTNKELETISNKIMSSKFSLNIREIDIGGPKRAFVTNRNAPVFFALKQIQYNIRRLYKVKQANRHQIVCQLRELLRDKFPKIIIRTDISSFYETIPRKQLLKKIRDDSFLTQTSKRIIHQILFEYGKLTSCDIGLPRGIGISAYLAELYMRNIDDYIRDYPGVLFYARYVDDIVIIYCPPPNASPWKFYRGIAGILKSNKLKRNRQKTKTFLVKPGMRQESVQYLGYKLVIESDKVKLRMTDKKMDRYKKRIELAFTAYHKQSMKSEKKACSLLERRIRFLTGNTRLLNNKKNVISGIFFSNILLNDMRDLVNLDNHLYREITGLTKMKLRKRLSQNSFLEGYKRRRYHKFSAQDLYEIVRIWKYVS